MSASRPNMESDLAKVDAYRNTAEDYAEIPELSDAEFARATPHRNGIALRGRPPAGAHNKKQITLRLDEDVIDHFRREGAGWQTRINAALRRAIGA